MSSETREKDSYSKGAHPSLAPATGEKVPRCSGAIDGGGTPLRADDFLPIHNVRVRPTDSGQKCPLMGADAGRCPLWSFSECHRMPSWFHQAIAPTRDPRSPQQRFFVRRSGQGLQADHCRKLARPVETGHHETCTQRCCRTRTRHGRAGYALLYGARHHAGCGGPTHRPVGWPDQGRERSCRLEAVGPRGGLRSTCRRSVRPDLLQVLQHLQVALCDGTVGPRRTSAGSSAAAVSAHHPTSGRGGGPERSGIDRSGGGVDVVLGHLAGSARRHRGRGVGLLGRSCATRVPQSTPSSARRWPAPRTRP